MSADIKRSVQGFGYVTTTAGINPAVKKSFRIGAFYAPTEAGSLRYVYNAAEVQNLRCISTIHAIGGGTGVPPLRLSYQHLLTITELVGVHLINVNAGG